MGILLKETIEKVGYTVKDIQKILHLSCPQPIYRWFKGIILPSVNHLYVLSRLLKLHMEDLLVPRQENIGATEVNMDCISSDKRLYEYQESLHRAPTPDLRITHIRGSEEVKIFMAKRNLVNSQEVF